MKKIIITLLVSFQALALINVGTYVPGFLNTQSNTDGGSTKFKANPFISLDAVITLPWSHYFNPEVGYVIHTDAEDETSHKTIFLGYNLEYALSSQLLFRYGFTNFITKIGGDGKEVELQNGTSTRTFYTPSESRTSYTSSFNLGAKYFVSAEYGVRFDLNIQRFLSSERRNLSYILSVVYK